MKSLPLNFLKWDSVRIVVLFLFGFILSSVVHAQTEQILGFHSVITINKDASIDVTETISVYANREKIRHGLMRSLRTRYTVYGREHSTHYRVTKVLMNGEPANFHIKTKNNSENIYIGDADIVLKPDIYVFTISYHANNVINFLPTYDEFYWNVTGNEWDFPILKTQADIILPPDAGIIQHYSYSGIAGEKNTQFDEMALSQHEISFTSSQTLMPGEGLTVALAWQKGVVMPPTWYTTLKNAFTSSDLILLEIALSILGYFLLMWYWHGRDPKRGNIVPLFEPPANISAAAMRYIMQMGYDMKTFTVGIVSLATKGLIDISEFDGNITLMKKTSTTTDIQSLPDEEQKLYLDLFDTKTAVPMDKDNAKFLQKALSHMKRSLKKQFYQIYFITNLSYSLPAWILTILALATAVLASNEEGSFFLILWLSFWTIACIFLVQQFWQSFKSLLLSFNWKILFTTLFSLTFALPFIGAEIVVLAVAMSMFSPFTIPILITIVFINITFYYLMKIPTKLGRQTMDQIEGFKMYLRTAERYRLNMTNFATPQQLFEKYLPYAIALDIENEWGEQFNAMVREASTPPTDNQPSWYHGSWHSGSLASFPLALSAGVSSAMASSVAPSGGSGSGGGGSSGGGGGGGGGGGW